MSETHTPPSSEKRDVIAERSATMPLITMDKKYKLRGYDYPVRVLCVDIKGKWPVLFLYEVDGVEYLGRAHADGTAGVTFSDPFDLIEVQEPVTFWLNVNPNLEGGVSAGGAYDTREEADLFAARNRLDCFSVPYDPNKA